MKAKSAPPENDPVETLAADLYFRADSMLGEGPVWSEGTLYWVDISAKAIFTKRDQAAAAEQYDVGLEVGALALWKNDQLVLATEHGFQSFHLATRQLTPWVNPEATLPDNRFNDGKCDPRGRFVAGTLHRRGGKQQGALYVLDHDRSVREIYRPVTCSNGLAWSEDGKTLYYIDTPTRVVRSFAYDLETARLSRERVAVNLSESPGKPDGMTIDRDGNLWIALWDGWGVECWNPATGRQLARIEVPAARVTSCIFGGEDYDHLFITTARSGLEDAALAGQELAGSVFCARPGVAGFPAVSYKGNCHEIE